MEIVLMQKGHPFWDRTIAFADACSWKAGPVLAKMMRKNAFQPWERVIAAVDGDRPAGFCTFTEKDELPPESDFAPFIGFVFVDEAYRGRRLSERMIRAAFSYARSLGYETVYIMSGETGLYEKYGFQKIGMHATIYGTEDQLFSYRLP